MNRLFVIAFLGLFLLVPESAGAQIVPMQCSSPQGCGSCEFISMVNNLIQFIISQLLPLIAVGMFVFAGFLMVIARGDNDTLMTARRIFYNVALGMVIVLAAWLIINVIMSIMLGSTANIVRWNQLVCVYPNAAANPNPPEFYTPTFDSSGNIVAGNPGATTYSGSCELLGSGPCSEANLQQYFGSRAAEASRICNKESGGAPVFSGSDLCCAGGVGSCSSSDPSFSGGYFQLNILANDHLIPGCNMNSIFQANCQPGLPCQTEGSCVRRNSSGICTGWSCIIDTSSSMYQTCMQGALDPATNFAASQQLFNSGGFGPWSNSAQLCSVPQ